MNRTLKVYPAFKDFYGLEETIERIVGFFRHAAQGLEEKKQILYLLGPVGGGKSSLADRLKDLMEKCPVYVLATNDGVSPIFESPLGLFDPVSMGRMLEDRYGIPERLLMGNMSPWAVKRLDEFGGDISKFSVIKLHPSKLRQICVAKTEPGDENNQDISSLVGKVDIRKLEHFGQNDADAYSYSGGLNRTTQGVLEFVEMFKAPLKMLHPLLTATQDRTYVGTENVGAMPYQGLIIAHSNESEWQSFRANKNNEAFLDRISVIKVPYCLRVTEEKKIYEKLLAGSELKDAAIAPGTLEMLARFSVLTRLEAARELLALLQDARLRRREPEGHRSARQDHPGVPRRGRRHGGHGRRLDAVRLQDPVGDLQLRHARGRGRPGAPALRHRAGGPPRADAGGDRRAAGSSSSRRSCRPRYAEFIGNEIQKAYLESYHDFGQNLFDRYVAYADAWIEDHDFKDPDTGQLMSRQVLEQELSKIEKPAGIANPKDFRFEVVKFSLRARSKNGGKNPSWTSYEKIREVIERRMFSQVEDLLPVISFGKKQDSETEKKHEEFVQRMVERGYTPRQVRRLVEWYMRVKKSS